MTKIQSAHSGSKTAVSETRGGVSDAGIVAGVLDDSKT